MREMHEIRELSVLAIEKENDFQYNNCYRMPFGTAPDLLVESLSLFAVIIRENRVNVRHRRTISNETMDNGRTL